MKPLYVLLGAFIIALLAIRFIVGLYDYPLAGTIAMSAMLLFTAIGHFAFTGGMVMMMPEIIPWKKGLVYLTGVMEIVAAGTLLVPGARVVTAWLLIAFFIIMLPANINAAVKHIDYQKGTNDGPGPRYLWIRVPLQALFIAWVYFFGVH